jgi:hypothetical protein
MGHRKSDDTEAAAREPLSLYFHAIGTDGAPVRRPEPMNIYPTFCYLNGSEGLCCWQGDAAPLRRGLFVPMGLGLGRCQGAGEEEGMCSRSVYFVCSPLNALRHWRTGASWCPRAPRCRMPLVRNTMHHLAAMAS